MKSIITSILLTLCPEYKLLTPILKSAYLSLLNIVLADFVPVKQTFPSMMNHSLFTLSSTLISGLLAPFLGYFSRCHGISHKTFAFSFSRHGTGWLCLYHDRESWDSLNSNFSNILWYSGCSIRSCLSFYSVCAILEQPHSIWGTVSWSLEHNRQLVSSTLSWNLFFLYTLVFISCCLIEVSPDRTMSGICSSSSWISHTIEMWSLHLSSVGSHTFLTRDAAWLQFFSSAEWSFLRFLWCFWVL